MNSIAMAATSIEISISIFQLNTEDDEIETEIGNRHFSKLIKYRGG